MTGHAAFFKADGLIAFGAFFSKKTLAVRPRLRSVGIFQVAFFQDSGNGVRDGEHQAPGLKHRVFAADARELFHNVAHFDTGAQGQGDQAADGFGLGGSRAPGFADGGEYFEGAAFIFSHRNIEMAHPGFHAGGESL